MRLNYQEKRRMMGKTVYIHSIEEMCDLMCDNKIPEGEQTWIFTFGSGQQHAGHYVKIDGIYDYENMENLNGADDLKNEG